MFAGNRVIADTGITAPIFQAPMGWIARGALVGAASEAGALGIMETSSGDVAAIRAEMAGMAERTRRPWAVNLPIAFIKRDDSIIDDVLRSAAVLVTTSAGHPGVYAARIKDAGKKLYHAVPDLDGALRAEDAGVDGIIVEGAESGAFRSPREVHTFTLLRAVRRRTALPIVAAGGIADGAGMAAAFALGAEAVQMGTRFVASAESPVHDGYKQAIVAAGLFSTTVTNRGTGPCLRALRTPVTEALEAGEAQFADALDKTMQVYSGGRLDLGLAPAGESAALIDAVLPCRAIVETMLDEYAQAIRRLMPG